MKILNEDIFNGEIVLIKTELAGVEQEYLGIVDMNISSFNKIIGNDFSLKIYNGSEEILFFKIKNIKDIKVIKKGEVENGE